MDNTIKNNLDFMVVCQERDRYHQIACEYACALELATNRCDESCSECGDTDGPRWCARVVEKVTGRKTGRAAIDEIKEAINTSSGAAARYSRKKKTA